MAMSFDPGKPGQSRFTGWGRAPIPDARDKALDEYVGRLREGGPEAVRTALEKVSEEGRRVLRAYAERAAARAVRAASPDLLVSALVAVVVGGLDHNAREALMSMALIDDAGRRVGADVDDYFGPAAAAVGHPGSVNLVVWLGRPPEDRTPEAMGFEASQDASGFRYKYVP